ncbi:ABC transporter substrate-binding protein [Azospirillum doebereinerae]|uniref:ABC transporter substrate-binding protein n=1 Tax=Azospirillum doebereinerae TaxID=92933 RepID=UPI001EE5D695|nr:ABC transporter substrate-binding protein [Azospirillum doebereinerae]MCG5243687.1 ABC transporter substrate-binding protein [Azospirillum doebereinerae]
MTQVFAYAAFVGLLLASASAQAQLSGDAVKIGVLIDQSGIFADMSGKGSIAATELAVEDFGGSVLGRKISIVTADHQNKPDLASSMARTWVESEGVDVLVDITNSAVALAVQSFAKSRGVVALHSSSATTRLTNEDCSPTGFHWTLDTYSQAVGSARAVVAQGGKKWFLLVADYAFGHQMAADLTREITAQGGVVVGSARHPSGSTDFSSYLLQAQQSGADIIGLANGGGDTITAIKQAGEFGLTQAGQKLVGLVMIINDVHAMGLENAHGLLATTAFYWDRNDESRAFSERFERRVNRKPNMMQAGVYSAVLHYLKAVQAAGTDKGTVVAKKMRELPVNDFFAKNGRLRADGRHVHDMYLVEVKKPSESQQPWDYYKVLRTIPADQTVIPLAESKCSLVK